MSEITIYQNLRAGGLSPAGACAVMGNMWAESSMISNNVQNCCTISDEDYTSAVDDGRINPDQFVYDKFGYGLCQWTFWSRKLELWKLANSKQVSVANEEMQCELCLTELKRDYNALYHQLCSCQPDGLMDAVEEFCKKFENPEVKNVKPRYQAALGYLQTALHLEAISGSAGDSCTEDACPVDLSGVPEGEPYFEIGVPPLRKGSKGTPVAMLQAGLKQMGYYTGVLCRIDGDFGTRTEKAVKEMQAKTNQPVTGIVNQGTWQVMFL